MIIFQISQKNKNIKDPLMLIQRGDMRRMLSSGNYIEYKTIKDTAIIKSFIKTKAYSNQANIESKIDKLIAYEKKRNATKKNYCIKLRVMISRSLSKQQKHELAKQFMFNISLDYKFSCV